MTEKGWFFNSIEDQEQLQRIKEKTERLGITSDEMDELGLPIVFVDEVFSDAEILKYAENLRIEKAKKANRVVVPDIVEEVPTEDTTTPYSNEELLDQYTPEVIDDNNDIQEVQVDNDIEITPIDDSNFTDQNNNVEVPQLQVNTVESTTTTIIEEEKPKVKRTRKKTIKKEEIVEKEVEVKAQPKIRASSTVKEVDVSKLKILNVSSTDAQKNYFDYLKTNNKSIFASYEVTLPQSGYKAQLRGLTAEEMDLLRNSVLSNNDSLENKLQDIIYACIQDTSIGHITYEEFMVMTAAADYNILLFAVMHQTFGKINKFNIECSKCDHKFEKDILTEHLIHERSDELKEITLNIINAPDKKIAQQNSLLNTFEKNLQITDTDIIVTIKYNNIKKGNKILNYLKSLSLSDEQTMTRKYQIALVLESILLPQYNQDTKEIVGYAKIESIVEIWKYLDTIPESVYDILMEDINAVLEPYKSTFSIPEIACPNCRSKIASQEINISVYFLVETLRGVLDTKTENS